MTVVKRGEIAFHFSGRARTPVCVLIHGADRGAVLDLCSSIVKQVTGRTDPLSVVQLTEAEVVSSEDRLYSEFAARSMFGDKLVVRISEAGDPLVRVLEPILASGEEGNLLLIDSSSLPKNSKLRKLCEQDRRCLVCALYEESALELRQRLERQVRSAGMSIDDDAMERLLLTVSRERAVGESEVNKLLIFTHGQSSISVEDVAAACGDTGDSDADELFDAVFEGQMQAADRHIMALQAQGAMSKGILPLALQHVARLQSMSVQIRQGQSVGDVVSSPRNNVFFKRRASVSRQLQNWPLEALLEAEDKIGEAILLGRRMAELEDTLVSRALLALSWQARSLGN
jgi:DNA polymerase-3 subunit delta